MSAKISAGDTLTIMGVPPGSGQRMAIDRDSNGVRDADEPLPALQISQFSTKVVLTWPVSPAGFQLQQADNPYTATWLDTTNPVQIVGSSNFLTNDISYSTFYFRLRR